MKTFRNVSIALLAGAAVISGQVPQPPPPPPIDDTRMRAIDQEVRAAQEALRNADIERKLSHTVGEIDRMADQLRRAGELAFQAAPMPAPVPPVPPGAFSYGFSGSGRMTEEERVYRKGKSALEDRDWDRAVQLFQELISRKVSSADAAMYWKAYALNKLGRRNEALSTLGDMMRSYANSRWLDDARALEVEVKQSSGQPVSPEAEADEDLKILAVNGMIHTDPERAIPVLESLLKKSSSPRLKERALFVLAQSRSPKAWEILLKLARGGTNPDLQYRAVEYLGYQNTPETRQALSEIYGSSSDVHLKRAVLRGFAAGRDKDHLLNAAKSEQNLDLRREAIRGLGALDANEELWQLYRSESSKELKQEILRALPGRKENVDRLIEAARAEKDPALRAELIRQIGYSRSDKGPEVLAGLYASEKDYDVRKAIIGALRSQNSAKALVNIARAETDPRLKRVIVETLSRMKSKEASDYLVELLNK
ncbi:MAG: HEAT repeat domain-containing protein [Bryobacterales bacterium]|nr:HEAT repeat domain-containing protein [Bryobacterales bacterium]